MIPEPSHLDTIQLIFNALLDAGIITVPPPVQSAAYTAAIDRINDLSNRISYLENQLDICRGLPLVIFAPEPAVPPCDIPPASTPHDPTTPYGGC